MSKIAFRVVSCTGAEDQHPISELETPGPLAKGWQSQRFCSWPQIITLELPKTMRITKVQILSHQSKIPTKIVLAIADPLDSQTTYKDCKFVQLGHISFSDNVSNNFSTRELKSVHLDTIGRFLRFTIKRNHINQHNLYNQVGIIAINVLGEEVLSNESKNLSSEQFLANNTSGPSLARHSNGDAPRTSPSMVRPTRLVPVEEAGFDIYMDKETSSVLKALAKEKEAAIAAEDYHHAKHLKEIIQELQLAGEELGRLELIKQRAVQAEDYDAAANLKLQMDSMRSKVFYALGIHQDGVSPQRSFEHFAINSHPFTAPVIVPSSLPKTPPLPAIGQHGLPQHPSTSLLDAKRYVQGGGSSTSLLNQDSKFSAPDNNMNSRTSFSRGHSLATHDTSQNGAPSSFNGNADSLSLNVTSSLPRTSLSYEDRPLPALRNKNLNAGDGSGNSLSASKGDGLLDSKLPPMSEEDLKLDSTMPYAPSKAVSQDAPDPLSEKMKDAYSVAINVFGELVVASILSKSWPIKIKGLEAIEKGLRPPHDGLMSLRDTRSVSLATGSLLALSVEDKIKQVSHKAQELVLVYLNEYTASANPSRSDLSAFLDACFLPLSEKCSDMAPFNRDFAKSTITSVVSSKALGKANTALLPPILLKKMKEKAMWREIQGRMDVIALLVKLVGADPDKGGFDPYYAVPFICPFLKHPKKEAREAAIAALVAMYQMIGDGVRKYLDLGNDAQTIKLVNEALEKCSGEGLVSSTFSPSRTRNEAELKTALKPKKAASRDKAVQDGEEEGKADEEDQGHQDAFSTLSPQAGPHAKNKDKSKSTKDSETKDKGLKVGKAVSRIKGAEGPKKGSLATNDSSKSKKVTNSASSAEFEPSELKEKSPTQIEKSCIFCGVFSHKFDEKALDLHYWKHCPMLMQCAFCKQVVEISMLTNHWLTECSSKDHMKVCKTCKDVFHEDEYKDHVQSQICVAPSPNVSVCVLCHASFPTGEQGWKRHLMGDECTGRKKPPPDPVLEGEVSPLRPAAPKSANNGAGRSGIPKPRNSKVLTK